MTAHCAKASPERGGGTANGRDGEVLRGIEFPKCFAIRQPFNLSVASGDSSPFRGAFRKAHAAMAAQQTPLPTPIRHLPVFPFTICIFLCKYALPIARKLW